jgi:predicted nucleic acid-binding protein
VTACVLGTDVVIAALDRSDAHHQAAGQAVRSMLVADVPMLLSVIDYAETMVRPAEHESTLRVATTALDALGLRLIAPTPAIARDAARLRALNISFADAFALATARANDASVASFDRRVRRVLPAAGVELAPALRG